MMHSYTQLCVYILLTISEILSAWPKFPPNIHSCSVYVALMTNTIFFPSPHAQMHTLFLASAKNISDQTLHTTSQTTLVDWYGHHTSLCLSFIASASTTGRVKMLLPYDFACAEFVSYAATNDFTRRGQKTDCYIYKIDRVAYT